MPTRTEVGCVAALLIPSTLLSGLVVVGAIYGMFAQSKAIEYGDTPGDPTDLGWILAFVLPIAVALGRASWIMFHRLRGRIKPYLTRRFGLLLVLFLGVPYLGLALAAVYMTDTSATSLSVGGALLNLMALVAYREPAE